MSGQRMGDAIKTQSSNLLLSMQNTNLFAVDFNVGHIVLEDRGYIDLRELVFREDNEETCLPTGSVPDDDQLLSYGSHAWRWIARLVSRKGE